MNHNFEKKISDKLNHYEIEPSEGLLDSIFEKRTASKKGLAKFPFGKLAVVVSIVAIISTAAYYFGSVNNLADLNTVVEKTHEVENSTINIENKSNNLNSTSEKNIFSTTEKSKKEKKIMNLDRKMNINKAYVQSTISGNAKDNFKVKNTYSKTLKNKKLELNENNILNTSSENIAERYFNILSKNRPTIAFEQHKGKSHLYIYKTIDEKELDNKNINGLINYGFKKLKTSSNFISNINQIELSEICRNIKKQKPIFLDLFLSPSITLFKAKDKADVNNYYNQLNSNSFNQMYGFRVSVPIANRINIVSGLNYTEQTSLYKGAINSHDNVINVTTKTEYINDPIRGTIICNYQDTSYSTVSNTYNYNFNNNYKIFQLPLGFSYNLSYGKFDIAPHIATLFNIYSQTSGRNIDFKSHNTHTFNSNKKQLGIGAALSFMAAYRINNKFKIILEPGVQWYNIKANSLSNKMSESRLNNQLTIGLRYTIF